ncbi:M949_RS01915 family surface polysaccharide biosynthesis protein [Massilia pseudoviolaceinigra]|uniref:M949_RS01915 family surface polysaccharide biosynthesis protein n=1 Tax=Massilia pseudoviolaceinigra TaxID=3057165 RepID=UPI0035B56E57
MSIKSAVPAIVMFLLTLTSAASPSAFAAEVAHTPLTSAVLKSEHITVPGKLVKAARLVDSAGEHILVVSMRTGPSSAFNAEPGRDELYELFSSLYTRKANRWARTWLIEDANDCPVIDSSASFFPKYITITDLDNNGVAEVTVPYTMFCSGGVDSSDLKVIMRQGVQKFAMRGRTLTGTEGGSPYGGEMVFDKSLSLKENAVFKAHLKFIRDKVYIEN